jgi:transcriptional regulator with XRE-family HTH domain
VSARDDFGPSLRRERERRGISLDDIAAKTKISATHFAAMERNDFSRWPSGIFRRSFLRAYAEAVGLEGDLLVSECQQIFPCDDDGRAAPPVRPQPPPERAAQAPVRTTPPIPAHAAPVSRRRNVARGLAILTLELVGVASVGLASGLVFGRAAVWPALAVAAVLVFIGANVLIHRNAGSRSQGLLTPPPAPAKTRPITNRRPIERQQAARRHRTRRSDRPRPRI